MPVWQPPWDVNEKRSHVVQPPHSSAANKHPGWCEFLDHTDDFVHDAGYCSDKTFCPARIYQNPLIFTSCPGRLKKLAELAEKKKALLEA
jgi:hypothetical protein